MSELVWYAAYGSNLSRARFDHYLRGGTPAGAGHAYPGCRDPSHPLEDRPWEISSELVFGGTSRTWGGGVAFVDRGASTAKARLYLITLEQFEDVVAQENWLQPGSVSVRGDLSVEIDVGAEHTYRLLLPLGEVAGRPVLTLTQRRGTSPAKPSARYLRHIADGLSESHSMTLDEVASYLSSKRGIEKLWTEDQLRKAIDGTV